MFLQQCKLLVSQYHGFNGLISDSFHLTWAMYTQMSTTNWQFLFAGLSQPIMEFWYFKKFVLLGKKIMKTTLRLDIFIIHPKENEWPKGFVLSLSLGWMYWAFGVMPDYHCHERGNKAAKSDADTILWILFHFLCRLFRQDLKPENLFVWDWTCENRRLWTGPRNRSRPPYTDYVSTRWWYSSSEVNCIFLRLRPWWLLWGEY